MVAFRLAGGELRPQGSTIVTTSRPRLLTLSLFASVLALSASVLPAVAQEAPGGTPVTVATIVETAGGPLVQRHTAPSMQEARQLVEELRARDEVAAAAIDVRMRSLQDPIDPDPVATPDPDETPTPAGDPDRPLQWAMDRLRAEEAWDIGDARNQVVAVVDSGVDASHPDLAGVVLDGFDAFTPQTRGRVDPLSPCPGASSECRGHGTHVAGVIAAVVGNNIGIAGLARGASIMPIRVLDPAGFGDSSDVATGIIFAADNGASVINLSLGSTEESDIVDFAVAYANRRGSLVVAAAGNVGRFTPVIHPAADPWTLAVGTTDQDDSIASFSGQAPWVDLAAPGVDIWSTRPISGSVMYASDSGTSMSTPYVSAAAALVQRHYPSLSPTRVAAHLRATATDLPPAGRDPASGDGLVNPVNALTRQPSALQVCDRSRVPTARFIDASADSNHRPAIDCAVWFNVAQGISEIRYGPSQQVTRAQMASFIARLLARSGVQLPSGGNRFTDVPTNSVHRDAINRLAAAGIVQGAGSLYGPSQVVTRDQMASFLVRSYDYAQGQIGRFSLPPANRQFLDTSGNVHEAAINKAAIAGFANGVSAARYAPRQGVRRDQMATFVIRTLERLATQV